LVLPGSRARIVRCGGRYDPQLVKRSSEWVSELLIWLSYIVHQRKILFLKKSGFIITVVWSIFSRNTHRSIGRIMSKFSIHILYSNSNNNIKQHMWHHLVVVSINNRKLSMFWLWTLNFIFTTAGSQQSNTVHSKIHEKRNTDMYKKKLSQNC